MADVIVVDVETTGTNPDKHAIISLGAVDLSNPTRQFYRECRIWEGAEIQEEALAVNGATVAQVTDPTRDSQHDAIGAFVAFCKEAEDRTLGGHNTNFDASFLQASANRCNLDWHFGYRVLDLHSFGWMHMAQSGQTIPMSRGRSALNSDVIFQYCGLPTEPKPHNGLMGAQMEAEAFCRLIYSKGLLEQFAQYPLPPHFTDTKKEPDQSSLF